MTPFVCKQQGLLSTCDEKILIFSIIVVSIEYKSSGRSTCHLKATPEFIFIYSFCLLVSFFFPRSFILRERNLCCVAVIVYRSFRDHDKFVDHYINGAVSSVHFKLIACFVDSSKIPANAQQIFHASNRMYIFLRCYRKHSLPTSLSALSRNLVVHSTRTD